MSHLSSVPRHVKYQELLQALVHPSTLQMVPCPTSFRFLGTARDIVSRHSFLSEVFSSRTDKQNHLEDAQLLVQHIGQAIDRPRRPGVDAGHSGLFCAGCGLCARRTVAHGGTSEAPPALKSRCLSKAGQSSLPEKATGLLPEKHQISEDVPSLLNPASPTSAAAGYGGLSPRKARRRHLSLPRAGVPGHACPTWTIQSVSKGHL